MFCLKDSLRVGLPVFVIPAPWKISHSSTGGIQNPHLISPLAKGETEKGSWIPALADSAGMTAEFYDEAVRHQL